MKKDATIALIAIALTAGICYGLAAIKLDLKPTRSAPFNTAVGQQNSNGHVIMRVNGEPVTEEEFQAAFAQLPEDIQRQLASPQGKTAFAEQLVRLKLLEQEARRLGVDKDPRIAGAVAADRTNLLASAVAQKLVAAPTDQAVRDFYAGNKPTFDSVDLKHILIAYAGGTAPARPGKTPLSQQDAGAMAQKMVQQLRSGAPFAQMALQYSDDVASAERGGELGPIVRGSLPPELETRVFKLKEGEISNPIVSRYGVHIFLAGRRGTQSIEQVRPAITRRVQQQNTLDRIEVLRRAARIDFDPKFFPQMQPKPAKRPS